MPGILEVYAYEYYANEHEDNIQEGIVGDLIVEPIISNDPEHPIKGDVFIKPKQVCVYTCEGATSDSWSWDTNMPIKKISTDGNQITIKWDASYSG
jgi:hypothetical protein